VHLGVSMTSKKDSDGAEYTPMDAAFSKALEGRDGEWALRAIAGYTMRQYCRTAETREIANRHGLARTLTAEERAAWTFGFTWVERSN
jgi:hypothetical protein